MKYFALLESFKIRNKIIESKAAKFNKKWEIWREIKIIIFVRGGKLVIFLS